MMEFKFCKDNYITRYAERTSYMLDEIALKTEHKDSIDIGKRSKTPG